MHVVLVGTVESTAVALEALDLSGHRPVLLVTLPVERAARHSDYVDLHPAAGRLGVPTLDAADVNEAEVLAAIAAARPNLVLVIGWSQIVKPAFLAIADAVGFHPAPLPEMRGRAVMAWTILTGRRTTGSTLLWLAEGVDDGDLLDQTFFDVSPWETAATLYDKHMDALATMLARTLPLLREGTAPRLPQDPNRATFCARRRADDGEIEWTAAAVDVDRLIRAVGRPYPGAWTRRGPDRLRVWACELLRPGPYIGLPGQVQAIEGGRAIVRCGDGGDIALVSVEGEVGGVRPAGELLSLHERLGCR